MCSRSTHAALYAILNENDDKNDNNIVFQQMLEHLLERVLHSKNTFGKISSWHNRDDCCFWHLLMFIWPIFLRANSLSKQRYFEFQVIHADHNYLLETHKPFRKSFLSEKTDSDLNDFISLYKLQWNPVSQCAFSVKNEETIYTRNVYPQRRSSKIWIKVRRENKEVTIMNSTANIT